MFCMPDCSLIAELQARCLSTLLGGRSPWWQDIMNLCRRSLQEADGVLIVVYASKSEASTQPPTILDSSAL